MMNLAQYLMTSVTPLRDVIPSGDATIDQSYRSDVSIRRAAEMECRYRRAFSNRQEMTSQEVGAAIGVSRPLTGLRKLEARGVVRMVRMSSDGRGRKQAVWALA